MTRTDRKSAKANAAQDIAMRILGFLAMEPDRIGRFCALTGTDPLHIRELAPQREFQLALLDHLLADESLLLVFCAHDNIAPEDIAPARRSLEEHNWRKTDT